MVCRRCDWLTDGEFQVLQDQEELPELRAVPAFQAVQDILEELDHLDIGDRKVDVDHQEEEEVHQARQVL